MRIFFLPALFAAILALDLHAGQDQADEVTKNLTREIMTVQARGDYAAAKSMLATRAVVRPEVQRVLDRLSSVPVDIEPRFVTADALSGVGALSAPRP